MFAFIVSVKVERHIVTHSWIAYGTPRFRLGHTRRERGRSIKRKPVAIDESTLIEPREAITDKGKFASSCVIFPLAVVLLVSHALTVLTVASIGVFAAMIQRLGTVKYPSDVK